MEVKNIICEKVKNGEVSTFKIGRDYVSVSFYMCDGRANLSTNFVEERNATSADLAFYSPNSTSPIRMAAYHIQDLRTLRKALKNVDKSAIALAHYEGDYKALQDIATALSA